MVAPADDRPAWLRPPVPPASWTATPDADVLALQGEPIALALLVVLRMQARHNGRDLCAPWARPLRGADPVEVLQAWSGFSRKHVQRGLATLEARGRIAWRRGSRLRPPELVLLARDGSRGDVLAAEASMRILQRGASPGDQRTPVSVDTPDLFESQRTPVSSQWTPVSVDRGSVSLSPEGLDTGTPPLPPTAVGAGAPPPSPGSADARSARAAPPRPPSTPAPATAARHGDASLADQAGRDGDSSPPTRPAADVDARLARLAQVAPELGRNVAARRRRSTKPKPGDAAAWAAMTPTEFEAELAALVRARRS